MNEIKSLEDLSSHELQGIRVVGPAGGNRPSVYAENQICKVCRKQALGIYHSFDVCMTCIVKAAQTFDDRIENYSAVSSEVRWRTWRKLRIRARKPIKDKNPS